MTKETIKDAIQETIKEARTYRQEQPEDGTGAIALDDYRRSLELGLDNTNPGLLRTIATGIGVPVGFVFSPLILAGGLAYLGGRAVYERIREHRLG